MRIEEAVDDDVDIENWDYSSSDDPDICDLILTTDGGDLQAVRAIRKKYEHLRKETRQRKMRHPPVACH